MAKSKNDSTIRSALLRQGTVTPNANMMPVSKTDKQASMQAAIAARRAEFQRPVTA